MQGLFRTMKMRNPNRRSPLNNSIDIDIQIQIHKKKFTIFLIIIELASFYQFLFKLKYFSNITFFYLYQGLTVLTYINKKSFFFKKIAISYSNLTLLLNFFYEKKKLFPRKTLSTKNRTTLLVHLRWFQYYYLYYYLSISISILLFKGLPLFGFFIFIVLKSPYISMFEQRKN